MANDAATLETALATALRDTTHATWTSAENTDLLKWSVARLWPKVARRVQETAAIVADQEEYTLTTVYEIDRVDLLDEDDHRIYALPQWEFQGDGESAGGTLYIPRWYVQDASTSIKAHGWGAYDLTTNLPYDRFVPLILAQARAEAGRREIARRMNFKQFMAEEQTQNVSVNELVLMVNEADNESIRLQRELKTWRRPRPAFGIR